MSSTSRVCASCGKRLRSNNQHGACYACRLDGRAPRGVEGEVETDSSPRRSPPPDDVLKRFRTVARALGKDPEAMLEAFARRWLDELAARAGTTTDGAQRTVQLAPTGMVLAKTTGAP